MVNKSNSSRWLRLRCEGDEKTVEFLSSFLSYFVGTANICDEEFEEALNDGRLKEVSKTQEYILELRGKKLLEAFLFSLLSGLREHTIGFIEDKLLILNPLDLFCELLKENEEGDAID